jgi:hypothetical protein
MISKRIKVVGLISKWFIETYERRGPKKKWDRHEKTEQRLFGMRLRKWATTNLIGLTHGFIFTILLPRLLTLMHRETPTASKFRSTIAEQINT